MEYTARPEIDGGLLSMAGQVKNGATFGEGEFNPVAVYYDPPPRELTRGQLARTYCLPMGEPVAFLLLYPPTPLRQIPIIKRNRFRSKRNRRTCLPQAISSAFRE